MRGTLITTKRELKEILKDIPKMEDNTQFILIIERQHDYFHIKGD